MIFLGMLAALGQPERARSAPILAVDVDPGSAGIQSTRTVAPGALVPVDIVIAGVESDASLNGFELDVDFVSSVLSATSVVDGGFLLPVRFAVELNLAAPDVNFAEVTLGGGGAVGDGVLARITFEAIGLGTSALTLNDVILSSVIRPGVVVTLPIAGIHHASVRVVESVIPEPTAALLFATGGVVLGLQDRRRKARGRRA